jgi:hypothetical protein
MPHFAREALTDNESNQENRSLSTRTELTNSLGKAGGVHAIAPLAKLGEEHFLGSSI